MYRNNIPYSLDQTPWLLFISSPEFVRRLFKSGDYSRAAFINTSSCQKARQSLEKLSIDRTDLGDSGPFADVED